MQYIATQKYLTVSPRKLREVVFLIKGFKPVHALEVLPHVEKRAKTVVWKALKAAVANAVAKGASQEDLVFKSVEVGDGPRLKRFRAGSRGTAKPIVRRMSHLRIVLETKDVPKTKKTATKKEGK